MTYRKKLIEVALPLEAINRESAREKSIRHGHPSTLHLWWARRPLAACRAVLFASIVDDPSSRPEDFPTEEAQHVERERLFRIIEELVKWENSNDDQVLTAARAEVAKAAGGMPPPVLDPFCGGGSIPVEAQRLGLDAYGSDLNPVAVLITKALVEIPARFAGQPPVNPDANDKMQFTGVWRGAQGLAADVRHYGKWMREEASRRIGHLYPKVHLTAEQGGGESTIIAWLWARTVRCPNPACGLATPLLTTFVLASKKGRERYLWPTIDRGEIRFEVSASPPSHLGDPTKGYKRGMSGIFECAFCGNVTTRDYVAAEGMAGRLGQIQTATVADGHRSRVYLEADQAAPEQSAVPTPNTDGLDSLLAKNPRDVWCRNFGLTTAASLFTTRQLIALTTLSDLVGEARDLVYRDALSSRLRNDKVRLHEGGDGLTAYADAVATYLGLAVSKLADYNSTIVTWSQSRDQARNTFARQALGMSWDFTEVNVFGGGAGDPLVTVAGIAEALEKTPASASGVVRQLDATAAVNGVIDPMICTDPPYYDNIGYADLSDFFYVWLRRSLREIFPEVFSTLLTPKEQELVAIPYRFDGNRGRADSFFEAGLARTFERIREVQHPDYPLTLFYAFKQVESHDDGALAGALASTGWETMLGGLLHAGFAVSGTWPMRSERAGRSVAIGTNALASSIVLVCRPRPNDAALATRREFIAALRGELPGALRTLQHGNIAPVDLAQAAIGPGMGVFSRYARVLEADGSAMRVRTALGLINQALDEVLAEQESEYDPATRWAVAWFEQFGMNAGAFGDAETLAKAKNTAVSGLVEDGFLYARGGKVRLLSRDELAPEWSPAASSRLTVWEVTQYLIRALEEEGEEGAALLLQKLGAGYGETARDLAYRLFATCEKKGWPQEALAFNTLVVAWPEVVRLSGKERASSQEGLF